jgi:predicted phage terminase large subunit-like protein
MFFKREWFNMIPAAPKSLEKVIRYWDRAATEETADGAASWTAGVLQGRDKWGYGYILHVARLKGTPQQVRASIRNIAAQDYQTYRDIYSVGLEQDPGQAGKAEVQDVARQLPEYNVKINRVRESKATRVKPFSAQAEAGNIRVVEGIWNGPYFDELENFDGTTKCISDQVDGTSGGYYMLNARPKAGVWGKVA